MSVEAPVSSSYYDTWLKIEIDYIGDTRHAGRKATIDPFYMETIRGVGGFATYGYGTFSASASNGYASVSMHAPGGANLFVSEVKYAIPGPPGSTWERSTTASFHLDTSHYIYQYQSTPVTNLNPNATATADIRPKSVLTLNDAECLDGCTLNGHGTVTFENAKRYYRGPTATSPNAELVGVTPLANVGHVVKGLKISGNSRVWRWDGDGHDEGPESFYSLDDLTPATPNDEGLYDQYPIYIEMTKSVSVTAILSSAYAILRVCSDTHWDLDSTEFHGHAWIEVTIACDGGKNSYGLYPDVAGQVSDVAVDIDLSKTAVHDRYYALSYGEWDSLMDYIEGVGDDYVLPTYNCARFAAACVLVSAGELLPYEDYRAFWIPTPRALSSSIKDKEEIRATAESNPLP